MKKVWEEPSYSTPPIVRMPIKTSLSEVLLLTNPWEKRDLDRKLAHISKDRKSRAKSLDWAQRHFFVQQIFDSDYNLRFTKQRQTFSEELKNKHRKKHKVVDRLVINPGRQEKMPNEQAPALSEQSSVSKSQKNKIMDAGGTHSTTLSQAMPTQKPEGTFQRNKKSPKQATRLPALIPTAQGAGIFLPQRQEGKEKLNMPFCSDIKSKDECNVEPDVDKTSVGGSCPNFQRVTSLPVISANRKQVNKQFLAGPRLTRSSKQKDGEEESGRKHSDFKKSTSLPHISNNRSTTIDFDTEIHLAISESPTKQMTQFINVKDDLDNPTEKLNNTLSSDGGEGDIISDITSKLPMSLMIKANQQVNKVVLTRKQKWIQKSKKVNENSKTILSDPRYENLTKALAKPRPVDCIVDDLVLLED